MLGAIMKRPAAKISAGYMNVLCVPLNPAK